MTTRTKAQTTAAIKAERKHRGIERTDADGTVWRFWSSAPGNLVWLTDGQRFKSWNPRHDLPGEIEPRSIEDLDRAPRETVPPVDDAWATPENRAYRHPRPRSVYGAHG